MRRNSQLCSMMIERARYRIVSETPKFDSIEMTKKIEPVKLEEQPTAVTKKTKEMALLLLVELLA